MLSDVTSDENEISPGGKVYQAMVADLLVAEYERRSKMEARGSTIVTASASLLTVIVGLTVIVTGKDYVFSSGWAISAVMLALFAFIVSAVLGIVVQTYSRAYWTISNESLDQLTTDSFWGRSANHAARDDVSQRVTTICTLRSANERTAKLVTVSLAFQVAAIFLLSLAVGFELCGHIPMVKQSPVGGPPGSGWVWSSASLLGNSPVSA